MFEELDWSDIFERGVWTFAQTFVATVAAAGTDWISANLWESAAVAGGAAVLSFLKNLFVQAKASE